jgi:hypothetical protein
MNADKIYQETLGNLAIAINNHKCPDDRASLKAFCRAYGFNRPNLCQLLKGTSKHDLSVGLFLRIVAQLGMCSPLTNTPAINTMSLRQYLQVDATTVQRAVMQLEFS